MTAVPPGFSAPVEEGSARVERWVGKSVQRKEDYQLLRGAGTFVADVKLADTLHAAVYRSPYGHAVIRRLDVDGARALPGVRMVLTVADLAGHVRQMAPFPMQNRNPANLPGHRVLKFHDRLGLADGKVRFAGEPVAVVVADSRYVAEDAIDLIDADYDPLPAVIDAEQAAAPDAPLLYEAWGDNIAYEYQFSGGDVERAFAEADVIVEERIVHHRIHGTPIEPRGILASYDPNANYLTVWDSSQIPHVVASLIKDSLAGPDGLQVRVVAPNVGGGFGQKWGFFPEEVLIPLTSILTSHPVKWIETRSEHMVSTYHAREQTHYVSMALRKDGTVLGVKDILYGDLGDAGYPCAGVFVPTTTAQFVPGTYKIDNYSARVFGVVTNKTPYGAHRGFGKAEAAFVIERMMDAAAKRLGLDPAAIRLRNFIPPEAFPYRMVTGSNYDSGDYPGTFRKALEVADYHNLRRLQEEWRNDGRLIGVGVCLVMEPTSTIRSGAYNSGYFSTTIRMDPSGQIRVRSGGNDEGQGHWTTISQLVADELGVEINRITVLEGDSVNTPHSSGSYASRFSVVGTSAAILAARELGRKLKRIGANMMEIDPGDVELVDGCVAVKGSPDKRVPLEDVARIAYHRLRDLPAGEEPTLEVTYHYRNPNVNDVPDAQGRRATFASFPYDANVAMVEVDRDTGRVQILKYVSVHDCGNILNPRIVAGQHLGALAHGVGEALYEELTYDEDGQLLNHSFKDYFVPTVIEIPAFVLDHTVTPNPFTPGGFKGAGETGTLGPPACLASAVEDALAPIGVSMRTLPATPGRVWTHIDAARRAVDAAAGDAR